MEGIDFVIKEQIDFALELEANNPQLFESLCLCPSLLVCLNSCLFLQNHICVTLSLQEFSCKKIRKCVINAFDKFDFKIESR